MPDRFETCPHCRRDIPPELCATPLDFSCCIQKIPCPSRVRGQAWPWDDDDDSDDAPVNRPLAPVEVG